MTFEKMVVDYLEKNGMFENQAQEVLEVMKNDASSEAMADRWNDTVSDYPDVMKNIVINTSRGFALKWIDENVPMAWYRPMFE